MVSVYNTDNWKMKFLSFSDGIFIIDIGHEKNAIREAQKLHLPIIGIVDTNHNPEGIDYVVPGNDDSIRAISYYAREVANAVLEAKAAAGTQTSAAVKKVTAKKPVAKKAEVDTPVKEVKEVKEVKKSEEKKAPAKA